MSDSFVKPVSPTPFRCQQLSVLHIICSWQEADRQYSHFLSAEIGWHCTDLAPYFCFFTKPTKFYKVMLFGMWDQVIFFAQISDISVL